MKIRYTNIAASVLFMSLMACTDEIHYPAGDTSIDENCITFTVMPESARVGTRSFGTADHIDQLIYKIYKLDDATDEYIEDEYYLQESDTYKDLTRCKAVDISSFPYTIKLIPNPEDKEDQEYKIVLWAQNKDSEFFDLSQFPDIKVNYDYAENGETKNYLNNEEKRDAFHCVGSFKTSSKGTKETLVLKRPFAQINIGTSGWDYEGCAMINPNPRIVKYSKIKISGIAKSFNALENTASNEENNLTEVTFDWAKIPAYRYLDDLTGLSGIYSTDHSTSTEEPGIFTVQQVEEEFLKVKLDKPSSQPASAAEGGNSGSGYEDSEVSSGYNYSDYISWKSYDLYCSTSKDQEELLSNIFTETFKYLSMSYVLVPFNVPNSTGSTVEIEFDCSVDGKEGPGLYGEDQVLKLSNVPVGNNHRTNIIATDGTGFFMNANAMKVKIYKETFADYYKDLGATDDQWGDIFANDNDNYEWPEEDISPYPEKAPVMINPTGTKLIDTKNNIIHAIKYFYDDVTFLVSTDKDYKYEFYLMGEKLDGSYYQYKPTSDSEGRDTYTFTITADQLNDLQKKYGIEKLSLPLDENETYWDENGNFGIRSVEVPDVRFYPFEFRVKTITSRPDLIYPDLVLKLRWYTSYKFTFSETSHDEGGDIWNKFQDTPNKGTGDGDSADENEIGKHYITNGNAISSSHITVTSRDNGNSNNNNNKIYAFEDHLRFRGAFQTGNKGHTVTLKGLKENCMITVKLGRDVKTDNSDYNSSTQTNTPSERGLHINWDGNLDVNRKDDENPDLWDGIPAIVENIGTKLGCTSITNGKLTAKTTYLNNETKIYKGYDTTITAEKLINGQDVTLYVDGSGHSYYWILLSEPED